MQRLDATFGLATIADAPIQSLTGLFILGLWLVEYTDNPIASYPTSITENHGLSTQHGDTVEATAVSLVGYGDLGTSRSQVARTIFVDETIPELPANLLPLAMVAREIRVQTGTPTMKLRRIGVPVYTVR